MKILTAKQMGEVDRLTSERFRIPSILLMENAGRSVVDALERAQAGLPRKRVLIFCGTGNNGGDGLVVARLLAGRGIRPEVWILGDASKYRGDALENWNMIQASDIPVQIMPDAKTRARALKNAAAPDVIVDGIFGTGLSKPMGPEHCRIIDWANRLQPRPFVVAVDMPSGLFADSHEVGGPVLKADLTITFTALKPALVLHPAAAKAGRVVVAPIGSPCVLLENPEYRLAVVDGALAQRALPVRARDSHKGTFGHVFALAGSRDKSGAALMTGMAALRAGAGLVTLMLPASLRHDMMGKFPELMTCWLPETREGTADYEALEEVLERTGDADAIVIGPGLSTNRSTQDLVRAAVRHASAPVILDADGINAFAGQAENLRNEKGHAIIITPHPGEMGRLLGRQVSAIQQHRLDVAEECAVKYGLFTVLKGHQTVIAAPDGRLYVNTTGNPGMATGGSGDILSGMMGRFVGGWRRKFAGGDAEALACHVCAAVYLHGYAGDLAAAKTGEESLIATDLLEHLPEAFKGVCRE
jgi:hydroxyethylthiazole kinase-like uncharacterized protein yjeF